ncbi:putative zinc-binding metallopeptidase [Alistipes sp. OttesenSCG-928-B03]|nr:putative zinc-binding metallopeptidase [Alistipes sp. OttesenSCG-928-B03]
MLTEKIKIMRNIVIIICFLGIVLSSCQKEDSIGSPYPIREDYILSQGNASQAANDKIQEIYDTYGSYIIYDFTQKDADWQEASSTGAISNPYVVDKATPEGVENFLKLIDKGWLKFIPDNQLKGKWLPYRVLLADTVKQTRKPNTYSPSQRNPLYYPSRVTGMSLTFADTYRKKNMTQEEAVTEKNKMNLIVWNYYMDKGLVDLSPIYEEITALSNYSPGSGLGWGTIADEAVYTRGFAPHLMISTTTTFALTADVVFALVKPNWYAGIYSSTTPSLTYGAPDTKGFLYYMLCYDQSVVAPALENYPLFKQKYDIVRNYMINTYGIDPQAIGNANAGFTLN